jgi:hypothetical protein
MKTYWEYMRESMNRKEVDAITKIGIACREYNVYEYTLNDDMSLDVDGDVYIFNAGLTKMPFKLNTVGGSLLLYNNSLINMDGLPKTVNSTFNISRNKLDSMVGGPISVGESYHINGNNIRSFKGFPENYSEHMFISFVDNPVNDILSSVDVVMKSQGLDSYDGSQESSKPRNKIYLQAIELCNEWDVIDEDKMEVSYLRLCEVFEGVGLISPNMEDIVLPNYKLVD